MNGAVAGPSVALDHVVVAAATLDAGAAWCEATLGVVPSPGGRHALMGTHNRLLAIGSPAFPQSYLEIIAVAPDAPTPVRARWFGLDAPDLRDALRRSPRLVHWVARTSDLDGTRRALVALGHDVGEPAAAERATPDGVLRWRITLPADGERPAGGAVPLLIEWDRGLHPSAALPPSGVGLARVAIGGVRREVADALGVAWAGDGPAPLAVTLATPRGPVDLVAA